MTIDEKKWADIGRRAMLAQIEGIMSNWHSAIWEAAQAGNIEYDMAGSMESVELLNVVRTILGLPEIDWNGIEV